MKVEERTPLSWPAGWERAKNVGTHGGWKNGFSKHSMGQAVDFVVKELERLGASDCVLTMNGFVRMAPKDRGVAVYFTLRSEKRVLACDRWESMEHNFWAIGKHVEALRGQNRWGVGTLSQAFAGYAALLERAGKRGWREVLGVEAGECNLDVINKAYRISAQGAHPDKKGGDAGRMVEINLAYEDACVELGEAQRGFSQKVTKGEGV